MLTECSSPRKQTKPID